MKRLLLIPLLITSQCTWAQTPETSLRPMERSGGTGVQSVQVDPSGAINQPTRDMSGDEARERGGLFKSLRPLFRSGKVEKVGRAERKLRAKGAVCGDLSIQGETVGAVDGRIDACGIENAVRVRSVSGIALSQSALMDCTTASALKKWVEGSAKPALSKTGGGLKGLRVAAHYICRTRNNQAGGKVSEHGKGRAIDISGFQLANGSEISVLQGWSAGGTSKVMRRMHGGACGPFGTVLGPDADRYHQDHFHFDTARYRAGTYCQ